MSTLKHTPGFWRRGSDDLASPELFCEIYDSNGYKVGVAFMDRGGSSKEKRESVDFARGNAQRMAAAPELLAELNASTHYMRSALLVITDPEARKLLQDQIEANKAVIRKATGQEGGAA